MICAEAGVYDLNENDFLRGLRLWVYGVSVSRGWVYGVGLGCALGCRVTV